MILLRDFIYLFICFIQKIRFCLVNSALLKKIFSIIRKTCYIDYLIFLSRPFFEYLFIFKKFYFLSYSLILALYSLSLFNSFNQLRRKFGNLPKSLSIGSIWNSFLLLSSLWEFINKTKTKFRQVFPVGRPIRCMNYSQHKHTIPI